MGDTTIPLIKQKFLIFWSKDRRNFKTEVETTSVDAALMEFKKEYPDAYIIYIENEMGLAIWAGEYFTKAMHP